MKDEASKVEKIKKELGAFAPSPRYLAVAMILSTWCPRGGRGLTPSFLYFPLGSQRRVSINQVPGIILCTRDMALSNSGRGLLLESLGWSPGIPLNIPQCKGWCPTKSQ